MKTIEMWEHSTWGDTIHFYDWDKDDNGTSGCIQKVTGHLRRNR